MQKSSDRCIENTAKIATNIEAISNMKDHIIETKQSVGVVRKQLWGVIVAIVLLIASVVARDYIPKMFVRTVAENVVEEITSNAIANAGVKK